ncbi:Putative vacuolar protein sorting-associated protein [Ooceraea biroi]|uniref:Putative vacuolar protein sorting-associated protein n=1 Tax=Ooceraea biroi TaxID=2015173 RepID=A0A026VVR2_OOCBI|nr:Putative vacuolar protein sorting-associated protein [Ooceraea biroi]
MTYPGLVLLIGVGIGLATFLYHVFTESNRLEEQERYSRNRRPSNHYEDWTERSHRSENAFLNRRSSSNSEARDLATSREDVNNCSICQYALNQMEVIQLRPCKHNFHKECINELRKFDPGVTTAPRSKKNGHAAECRQVHFHVTYWMFYPFSEGKTICVLDLGFFGSWPIPTLAGVCVGTLKEYGSHVGDWEHTSLYFKNNEHPLAMYVSAHDTGAFYRYDPRNGTFVYESQETRKGLFQKPTFPDKVYTAGHSHPILFSARGSHGLWTAPGKHRFVRVPRLYDEGGFGTAWPTWKRFELLSEEDNEALPGWMTFKGKWGNPSSNCHPLAKLGFNICQFVDGPTGIPMKRFNFRC